MSSPFHPSTDAATSTVPASLHALLGSIVDYAGLFPPARLPLEEAFDNYLRYRTEAEAWMLARFVIPAARLEDMAIFRRTIEASDPVPLSVLGAQADDVSAFTKELKRALDQIGDCHEQFDERLKADVMETRLPGTITVEGSEDVVSLIESTRAVLSGSDHVSRLGLFLELPFNDNFRSVLPRLLRALSAHNREHDRQGTFPMGLKIRTGGMEASAFPSAEDVAHVIAACRDAAVPFKATAGLHHPMYHRDESLDTFMHGFFNVFGAAAVAAAHGLEEADIAALLKEEDHSKLHFEEDRFTWGSHIVDLSTIREVRRHLATSFGSCSFDEPREDLQAINLL